MLTISKHVWLISHPDQEWKLVKLRSIIIDILHIDPDLIPGDASSGLHSLIYSLNLKEIFSSVLSVEFEIT